MGALVIGVVIGVVETPEVADTDVFGVQLGVMTAVAFFVGALCSMASGVIGMYISVKSNVRTAAAARHSLVEAVQVAMRGGRYPVPRVAPCSGVGHLRPTAVHEPGRRAVPHRGLRVRRELRCPVRPARRRDLHQGGRCRSTVGKIEAGIPEDDPRNAAVIADLVGDNVGDCAGRGADLFDSPAARSGP